MSLFQFENVSLNWNGAKPIFYLKLRARSSTSGRAGPCSHRRSSRLPETFSWS